MSIRYSEDFKKEVIRAYMADNKSTIQIAADYNIAKSSVNQWVNQYKEECLYTTNSTSEPNCSIVLLTNSSTSSFENTS